MKSIVKANSPLRNHLKLNVALSTDQQNVARFMEPEVQQAVKTLAERVAPLLAAADDTTTLNTLEAAAEEAAQHTKNALSRLQKGVGFTFETLPEALEKLGTLKLGADATENLILLRALADTLAGVSGFSYPPNLGPAEIATIQANHVEAFAALARARSRVSDATSELRLLRPQVERVWTQHELLSWIRAHVKTHEAQLAWGMPPKRRTRLSAAKRAEKEAAQLVATPEKAVVTSKPAEVAPESAKTAVVAPQNPAASAPLSLVTSHGDQVVHAA